MTTPKRIQLRRTKGWRLPAGAVVVSRPSRWGNPFKAGAVSQYRHADAVADFRLWILEGGYPQIPTGRPPTIDEIRAALRGKDLACWCPLDKPCHADVLLEIANA